MGPKSVAGLLRRGGLSATRPLRRKGGLAMEPEMDPKMEPEEMKQQPEPRFLLSSEMEPEM
jgi:hypothetical protein